MDWCGSLLVKLIGCQIILTASSHESLLICSPSPSLLTVSFSTSEVRRFLLGLDAYGGTDPLGVFPLFLKRTADVLVPRIS